MGNSGFCNCCCFDSFAAAPYFLSNIFPSKKSKEKPNRNCYWTYCITKWRRPKTLEKLKRNGGTTNGRKFKVIVDEIRTRFRDDKLIAHKIKIESKRFLKESLGP
jgi:hypothetical protein